MDAHGRGGNKVNVWRPNVALAMQPDLHFDTFILIYDPKFERLFKSVRSDIIEQSPDTNVVGVPIDFQNPWDFGEVYAKLYDFAINGKFAKSADKISYYIHITTGTHVAQICLFLLNESHHLPGKLIQTSPNASCGPRGTYTAIDLDLSKYDQIAERFAVKRENDLNFLKSGIDTKNKSFNALIEMIERVAIRSHEPILLMGPTGAGKSQLAKRIYELKKTTDQITGEFAEINCATLRGDQASSTLFGHKKGAFTGAVSDRPGLLKTADGGILFLDEIGELGLDEQAMLLRAIEEKRFLPLGSDKECESSFQLICGTNKDLLQECEKGKFRYDLFARINLWAFKLPGLAERREDIEPNIEYELNRYAQKSGKHITFNKEAHDKFMAYALSPSTKWQGNFRDLNAMIVRMATLSSGGRIDITTVEEEIERTQLTQGKSTASTSDILAPYLGANYQERYDPFDLAQLEKVIAVCRESATLSEAGKKLFSVSRLQKKTANDADRLAKYLAKFSLTFAKTKTIEN